MSIQHHTDQLVHAKVSHSRSQSPVFLTGIYAKCTRMERRHLWSSLLALAPSVDNAWLIGGDFNAIASVVLRNIRGPRLLIFSLSRISALFFIMVLFMRSPLLGVFFTWSGSRRGGRVHKKLDRLLCNTTWLSRFTDGSLELLSKVTSDHCPLLYKLSMHCQSAPKPLKFQHMWFHRPDFMEVVRSSWAAPLPQYGMFLFSLKLKRLKGAWNKDCFGNVHYNVQLSESAVKQQELLFEQSGSEADLVALNLAQAQYTRSLTEEDTFWRKKSRLRWLEEGDRNTKPFHASVTANRSHLSIGRF